MNERDRKPGLALIGAVAAAPALLSIWSHSAGGPTSLVENVAAALFAIALGVIGTLIVFRQPRNPVGWTFAGAYAYLLIDTRVWPLLLPYLKRFSQEGFISPTTLGFVDAYNNEVVSFFWWMALLFFPAMFFPNGNLPSPRWRRPVRLVLFLFLLTLVVGVFDPALSSESFPFFRNPLAIPWAARVVDGVYGGLVIAYLFAPVSLMLRFRKAQGLERQQFKWPLLSALLGFVALGSFAIAPLLLGSLGVEWQQENVQDPLVRAVRTIILTLEVIAVISFPITIGIAILRYRLYDIDVIIRRTLVYTVLSGTLALVYLGSVVLLQSLFGRLAGGQSPLILVLSTLLIAALFAPLRRRVQELIDRRFYRRKYDAQQVLAAFAETARDEVGLDELTAELVRVVEETMRPERISVWLKLTQPGETGRRVVGGQGSRL